MASNKNTNNYGTTGSEKGKLPFYHVTSRTSTDSTKSTDALLQKEPKKPTEQTTSAKAIMDCKLHFTQ
jgi:hypothetical protein